MLSALWHIFYYAWFASEIAIGIVTRTKHSTGNVRDRGSLILLWVVIVISLTACDVVSRIMPKNMFGGAPWLRIAALVVMIIGLAIRGAPIVSLGKSFSSNVAIHAAQTIKSDGLYRFVRHPSYLGLLLVFFATGLHSRNWASFVLATIPTTAVMLYRIHIEEHALTTVFGPQYAIYAERTKRLLPGLY